jgi:membrane dipeptidase
LAPAAAEGIIKMSVLAIADAHNDLLLELTYRRGEENPFARYWLDKLERGGVRLQVCPVYAPFEHLPEGALRRTLDQVAACHRAVRENPDRVVLVRTRADLDIVERGDRIGLLLSMEGAEPFGYDPEMADVFWELGVRMVSLTWQRRNAFADGNGDPAWGGLSRIGGNLVDRLADLGVILDLAHASDRTFADVLERAPDVQVVVSHAGCRAIVDTPRNVSDEQLEALAARGGVLGIIALPLFVRPEAPTMGALVDHFDHAVDVMGIEYVALGSDFIRQVARSGAIQIDPADLMLPPGRSLDDAIDGLAGPEDYGNLVAALDAAGYKEARLEAILHRNLLRILRRALPE